MKRIGFVASQISKGNIVLYHVYVVLIASLFSFLIFLVAGATVFFALMVIAYISSGITGTRLMEEWRGVFGVCMAALTVVTALFNLAAIIVNINIPRRKS